MAVAGLGHGWAHPDGGGELRRCFTHRPLSAERINWKWVSVYKLWSFPSRRGTVSFPGDLWAVSAPFTFLCRIFFFFLKDFTNIHRFSSPKWNQQQNKPSALWSQWSVFGVLANANYWALYTNDSGSRDEVHFEFWKPEKQNSNCLVFSVSCHLFSTRTCICTPLTGSEKTQLTHRPVSLTPWEYVSWSCLESTVQAFVFQVITPYLNESDWANCTHPMPMLRILHSFIHYHWTSLSTVFTLKRNSSILKAFPSNTGFTEGKTVTQWIAAS